MRCKTGLAIALITAVCVCCPRKASAGDIETRKITDHIYILKVPGVGESQLVITSKKGLVVFNTFWSEIAAQKYKDEIARAFDRNDFAYVINTTDRLDYFGGNAAYKHTIIVGHQAFLDQFKGKEKEVDAEIARLIDMWRWKEDVSRERLAEHEPGSDAEKSELRWANSCKQRAEELENGFSLVLPTRVYKDRMTLDLGDMSLRLIWFGRAGNEGMTVAVVPEEKVAIISGFLMHSHHLAPYPMGRYAPLDVPRWIEVLEEMLTGENAVETVICDINNVWTPERAREHLNYIKTLWESVKAAEAEGKDLGDVQDQMSFENEFAFVKDMQVYKGNTDDWLRPQHRDHVRLFYLQHKNMASEMIRKEDNGSLRESTAKIRKLRDSGGDVYFDEFEINSIGYEMMNAARFADAVDVLLLNVEAFPGSANVYDSLGEAYMKSGDNENAITNYKKSLELNPENNNATEMLKTLTE